MQIILKVFNYQLDKVKTFFKIHPFLSKIPIKIVIRIVKLYNHFTKIIIIKIIKMIVQIIIL